MDPAKNGEKEPSPLKQIRTFQGDIAEALGQKQASIVSVQQAEVARKEEQVKAREVLAPAFKEERVVEEKRKEETKGREKMILLSLGTLILLALGGAGVWYAYITYKTKTTLPVVTVAENRFIATQSTHLLDATTLTKDDVVQTLHTEENKLTTPDIEEIRTTLGNQDFSPLLSTQSFLAVLGSNAPGNLVRSFDKLFMLGIIGGTPTHTFMLIKLDSFENAFPGMLAWEGTMAADLLPIISPASSDNVPVQSTFSDITIQNKDARILRDVNGKVVLLYSFFNNNILIITDNEESLRTLISALTTASLSR